MLKQHILPDVYPGNKNNWNLMKETVANEEIMENLNPADFLEK